MPGNGEIGIIIGDNRFTCQESCEISFRSCLREQGKGQQILEPVRCHERADIARTVTEQMLTQYPALQAIYAPCGGVEGSSTRCATAAVSRRSLWSATVRSATVNWP